MVNYHCNICSNDDEFSFEGGMLFCSLCGNKVGKVKKAARGTLDKAELFWEAWTAYAPKKAPKILREYRFDPDRKYRFDFAFRRRKIAIEVDGGRWKEGGGRHSSPADYAKRRDAARLGWRIIPFLTEEIERDPLGCVNEVLSVLGVIS